MNLKKVRMNLLKNPNYIQEFLQMKMQIIKEMKEMKIMNQFQKTLEDPKLQSNILLVNQKLNVMIVQVKKSLIYHLILKNQEMKRLDQGQK